jgi:hypothetical protein
LKAAVRGKGTCEPGSAAYAGAGHLQSLFSMQEMGGEHVVFARGHGEGRSPIITEHFDD